MLTGNSKILDIFPRWGITWHWKEDPNPNLVSDSSVNGARLENTRETRTDMAMEVKGQQSAIDLMRWEPSLCKSIVDIRGGIILKVWCFNI